MNNHVSLSFAIDTVIFPDFYLGTEIIHYSIFEIDDYTLQIALLNSDINYSEPLISKFSNYNTPQSGTDLQYSSS